MKESKWYVITGNPCSGKTTIISQLSRMGYRTCPEAARILIDKGISKTKSLNEIRKNEREFQRKVLEIKIKLEKKLPKNKTVFFDRGLPDTIAYYHLYGFDTKEVSKAYKKKKYKKIFFLETLPFEKDYARTEDKESLKKLGKLLNKAYTDLNYEVINVPVMPIDDRVKFILSNL